MADGYGEYEGVGGWLAFFLVTLGVFTPGLLIFTTIREFSDPLLALAYGETLGTLKLAVWGLAIGTCLIAWFAVYRMLRVFNWTSVMITIGTLWLIALLNTFVGAWLIATIAGLPLGDFLKELNIGLVRPFIYAGIWTAYLLISRRVANTYRRDHDEDAAIA